ncbi:hypothetical protein NBT05_02025 [Aquimarina sp. ERC-38]|uniref:hypothetical protein n=1 Tax=Aquimarina sp. ERC-38 TaxID=2949996 RepID=UPI002246E3F8|nr:hypothetical protein [Aquimarina sp. ERC-38]UZO81264.1 hypothetical protein NBT05_02025 [Aquimarina sp. ERC-38]
MIFRTINVLFHPIIIPVVAATLYFSIAPRFIPDGIIQAKVFGILIITVLIPIVLSFFLKSMGIIPSVSNHSIKFLKIPLLIQSLLFFFVIKAIIHIYEYPELYFFFLGILFSILTTIFMILFSIRVNLHMLGLGAVTMFSIALSIHFSINLTLIISLLLMVCGVVATSQLFQREQSYIETILGFIIGLLPQLTLVSSWL